MTEPSDTPQGKVASAFAHLLVSGDFVAAHAMLTASLKASVSTERLKDEYDSMIQGGDPPDFIGVMEAVEDRPARQPEDVGWAYVAISGPGYGEAVAVVVAREDGRPVIRSIVWGRP
jgi:hypothetical protein